MSGQVVQNIQKFIKSNNFIMLFASIVLLTVGIYGTVVSSEYSCGKGLLIDPHTNAASLNSANTLCIKKYPGKSIQDGDKDFDKCINDNSKGSGRCMEGGMMTFSIISIIVGALMLLYSGYLMFKTGL